MNSFCYWLAWIFLEIDIPLVFILDCWQHFVWFRFKIWSDGLNYFEISTVRGYDHGEVKMVAENRLGREELSTTIEVHQAKDLRSVLHKSDGKGKGDVDPTTMKQYRITRSMEEKVKGESNFVSINNKSFDSKSLV